MLQPLTGLRHSDRLTWATLPQKFNNTNHECEMTLENGTTIIEVVDDQEAQAIPRMLYHVSSCPAPMPAGTGSCLPCVFCMCPL